MNFNKILWWSFVNGFMIGFLLYQFILYFFNKTNLFGLIVSLIIIFIYGLSQIYVIKKFSKEDF